MAQDWRLHYAKMAEPERVIFKSMVNSFDAQESRSKQLERLVIEAKADAGVMAVLWEAVKGFIRAQAIRRMTLSGGAGGVEIDDLCQAGYIALVEAVQQFDPERENSAFLPLLVLSLKSAFGEAQGIRTSRRDALQFAVSIDAQGTDDGDDGLTIADRVQDPAAQADFDAADDAIFQDQLKKAMQTALDRLSPVRRAIIKSRYYSGLTLKEIAQERNITPGAVQAAEGEALRQLRREARKTGLEQFVTTHTVYFYHYGIARMEQSETSPVEASVLQRERLEKLWESEKMYTVLS